MSDLLVNLFVTTKTVMYFEEIWYFKLSIRKAAWKIELYTIHN